MMRLVHEDEPQREIATGAMNYFELNIGNGKLSIERGIWNKFLADSNATHGHKHSHLMA
ncbi:hypothetical protein [Phyllobacterium myrsinacearum]|uniref:hypothetical protein n=1 Tax=Phyllobacterium myrsinacearum TaxID=28101 RepID=UPI0013EE425E|nr:hypothetical protein [Phyllobacterium myrsinacearum]